MGIRYKSVHWLWLSLAVIVADQVTKQLVFTRLSLGEMIDLLPVLNLTHRHNTGAAFSMFAGAPVLMFVLLGVGVSVGILWWLRKNPQGAHLMAVALTLILGGALGNVIDRVWRGFVVDFIDFHLAGWHWPAFNVADSAICIGAGLLMLDMFINRQPAGQE